MTTSARTGRVELTRAYHFSAGHCLGSPRLSEDENAKLYSPCRRPHGHNYYVEVTVTGTPHPLTGMAIDLAEIDRTVSHVVLDEVDHRTLEEVPLLSGVITTGEGLARAFWNALAPTLPQGALVGVTVQETAKNRFEYRGMA